MVHVLASIIDLKDTVKMAYVEEICQIPAIAVLAITIISTTLEMRR